MGEIQIGASFPLDDEQFFRRECPFCKREFKVLLEKEELTDLTQKGMSSFLTESQGEAQIEQEDSPENELVCPYCGQKASKESWWTQKQLAYINIFAENIMSKLINENLIRPLKKTLSGSRSGMISIHFKGEELQQREPWISPEVNDMKTINFPCCDRKIKIDENWSIDVYCFFCGFPYKVS